MKFNTFKILINMNEARINKDTKINYLRLKKERSLSITNIRFTNLINRIPEIITNGLSINLLKYSRTTQESILMILFEYSKSKYEIDPEEKAIVLDNWACLQAKSVRKYWEKLGTNFLFINLDWSELVPVEVYF